MFSRVWIVGGMVLWRVARDGGGGVLRMAVMLGMFLDP